MNVEINGDQFTEIAVLGSTVLIRVGVWDLEVDKVVSMSMLSVSRQDLSKEMLNEYQEFVNAYGKAINDRRK